MRSVLANAVRAGWIAGGFLTLAGCTGSSTPAAPPAAPAPAPTPPAPPPPPQPTAPCTGVTFLGSDASAGVARGSLTLDGGEPDTALDFARPYTIQTPDGGANLDIPGLRPTIGVFVSDLAFTPLGDGFRQTMTLEWISELEVRAGGPGCEPVSVSCNLRGCFRS